MPWLGYCLALLASVLWGLTYCLDERVLAGMSVMRLYFLHCLCGTIVAGAILLAQGQPPAALVRLDAGGAGRGLVALTLVTATTAALCILGSIQVLGAHRSAVLEISYPLFVALFSTLFFQGRLETPVLVGGGFILVGAAIVVLAS